MCVRVGGSVCARVCEGEKKQVGQCVYACVYVWLWVYVCGCGYLCFFARYVLVCVSVRARVCV